HRAPRGRGGTGAVRALPRAGDGWVRRKLSEWAGEQVNLFTCSPAHPLKRGFNMIRDLRIAVIGAGVMGEAIVGGLLKQQLVAPDQLGATELRAERRAEIEQRYGVRTTDDNVEAAHWAQVAIFAVKPQTLPKALPELRGALGDGELVISIVAGAPIRHF